MYTIHEADVPPIPMSEEDREKVREQLERLVETHHFKNSRRYPALLRFIVEETLEGRGEYLKERLLGIRVFDRPADYDTATDPVVRVTIAEIRKRIAQYYHDEEHDAEIRIELHPGSYAPEFRFRATNRELAAEAKPLPTVEPLPEVPAPVVHGRRAEDRAQASQISPQPRSALRAALWAVSAAVVVLLGVVAWGPLMNWIHPSAIARFWGPMLNSQRLILICVPTGAGTTDRPMNDVDVQVAKTKIEGRNAAGQTFRDYETLGENMVYSDMLATLRIVGVLDEYHRDYRARLNIATNLEDLRQGPSVLVGGLDNQWTMRALAPLRFKMTGTDAEGYWITDAKDPSNKNWSLDLKLQYGQVTRDYAIVARLHNEQTGQPQMIIAGIGMSGTAAAGELIGDERGLEELRKRIGPGFDHHDFEAVLSTDIVNGIAGAPKIIAVEVW